MYFMDAVPEPVKKPLHEHRQVLLCVGVVVQYYEHQQYKYQSVKLENVRFIT